MFNQINYCNRKCLDPKAESPYARGLMQISRIALQEVKERYRLNYSYDDMFNPRKNVEVGALYFKRLYNYYLTKYPFNPFALNYAIMAYNFGIGIVNNWLKNTKPDNGYIDEFIPKETREHLLDVMWLYAYYKNEKHPPADK